MQNSVLLKWSKWQFLGLQNDPIDFTLNQSGRKILKFPYWVSLIRLSRFVLKISHTLKNVLVWFDMSLATTEKLLELASSCGMKCGDRRSSSVVIATFFELKTTNCP